MRITSTEYPQLYSIIKKDKYTIPTKIVFSNTNYRNKSIKDRSKVPHLLEMRIERIKR